MDVMKVWCPEDIPERYFRKHKCTICTEKLWSCPECSVLLHEIARHQCKNRSMDRVLYMTCPNPEPHNVYWSVPSYEKCSHKLAEISNQPIWD